MWLSFLFKFEISIADEVKKYKAVDASLKEVKDSLPLELEVA